MPGKIDYEELYRELVSATNRLFQEGTFDSMNAVLCLITDGTYERTSLVQLIEFADERGYENVLQASQLVSELDAMSEKVVGLSTQVDGICNGLKGALDSLNGGVEQTLDLMNNKAAGISSTIDEQVADATSDVVQTLDLMNNRAAGISSTIDEQVADAVSDVVGQLQNCSDRVSKQLNTAKDLIVKDCEVVTNALTSASEATDVACGKICDAAESLLDDEYITQKVRDFEKRISDVVTSETTKVNEDLTKVVASQLVSLTENVGESLLSALDLSKDDFVSSILGIIKSTSADLVQQQVDIDQAQATVAGTISSFEDVINKAMSVMDIYSDLRNLLSQYYSVVVEERQRTDDVSGMVDTVNELCQTNTQMLDYASKLGQTKDILSAGGVALLGVSALLASSKLLKTKPRIS